MKKERIWYVVVNGSEARVLSGLPGPGEPMPEEIVVEAERRTLRDHLADRPTRSFASAGGGRRSAIEPGGHPLEEDVRVFLGDVFTTLERQLRSGSFDGLVLVGSADMVGHWRAQVPDDLAGRVRREIVRNLAGLPMRDLVEAIRGLEER